MSRRVAQDAGAARVRCPTCGASPGATCASPQDKPIGAHHVARARAAYLERERRAQVLKTRLGRWWSRVVGVTDALDPRTDPYMGRDNDWELVE